MPDSRPRVLLIDDDPDIREALTEELELEGFEVVPAGSGADALTLAGEAPVDVVLTDLRMPGMDGFTAIAELRRLQPGLRAIVATGLTGDEVRDRAAALGGCDFIEKPYDLDRLIGLLRRRAAP